MRYFIFDQVFRETFDNLPPLMIKKNKQSNLLEKFE